MADYSLIEGALQRGYSMDEIADKLAQAEGFDPSAIRARGYGAEEIIGRLGYVKPEEVKPEKGFIGNVLDQAAHGVKTAYQGLLSAPGIYAGNPDAERIAATIQAEQSHEKPKEMREAEAAFADVSKRQSDFESVYGKDSGYMDSIGKIMDMLVTTGKEIVTNPKGMAYEMASQSGNMVAPMVGAYAGGKTGAVTGALLGPKGAVAGGVVGAGAGGFAGSHVMEQSGEFRGKVAERLSELGLEPTAENVSAIFQDKAWLDKTLEETRDKATGTAVTDGVLAAIGGLAVNAPIRAAQKTARAQLGATATAKQVSDAAADILASQPKWQKVAPHLKAGAIGWGGEPISEATGQQYGYGHVDYGDVGMEAFAAAGEGIGSVYAAAKGMRTKPTLPANVTPPPSITSASSTDDAIKAFKDEVETVSPVPRGSFSGMDDLAGLIESERSDLGKRRGLLAQQQQEARDMEAEFSGLVKDEQIDQSYRLNDAQKQRDAERAREGGYDLALQQREEQQGRTVEQLAAASEAQGFGNEEPTAMQLAMQRAQQKALDNEFSGLLKQERANLNEMRANVKRVAGVPVEQISTPQLEEIAQSEAHPNTKMAAVAALNDRHDAIQQERERLMQLRETRLEKQSNQPEQGAQHGAESHGTDGQVATPSVAGGSIDVSGGGLDAAMVAADRGMRETSSAGAAVSSGGQVGAVPVADQPTNVRALTENGKPSASWVIRNKETGESLFETFDRKKVDALNTEKYEAVPILEYLQSLNKPRAESPNDAQIVNVRQHTTRRNPASNTIAQAIINLGGISTSLKTDILGDASIKTRPGLFTTNGTGDLGEIAAMLSSGFGFSQIDLNDPTDNSGAKQLADLIARSVNGETIHNEEGMILAQQAEEEAMHREDINNKAREFGIKPSGKGRPFSKVEAEVLKLVEMRLEKEIYRAGEEMQAAREFALKYFTQEEVDAICDKAVDQLGSDASILEIYQGITKAIYEAINENKGRNRDRAANSEAEGIDRESRRSGLPEAEDRRPAGEGEGAAREGQGAEVTPEFGLIGQTEEEAIAEEQARRDEDQRKADEDRAEKRRIDAEAVARRNEQNANTVASDNFQLGQSSQEVRRMVHSGMVDMFGNPTTEADDGNPARKMDEAARQAANISDDHANIPNMDGVRAAAQQILDAIEQDDLADYGLRVIPGEFEGDIAVGDVLPPSRVWEDGRETDDELLGTSTVEVGSLTLDGVLKSLNGLGAAGKPGPNGYYFGDRVVLVKGDRVSGGDDSGESLLKNASVVGVWRKASKGLSSILPNEAVAPKESGANTLDPVAAVKATLDAAGVTGTDRTTTIAAVRRGDLTPEDVAEAHPSPNVADSASEGKPIRPYATPDERNEAIWTLQAEAKSSGLEYSNESIKDAAEFGAPANEIAAAIDAGEDAVADLAERYAKRSNGLRQGFGQGNNDNALRENMKPPSEHEKRIASLTGRGLYELTEAQRSSLLKFAKVRSIDAFEDIAFSARREIIGQWLDMNPAETKQPATYTIADKRSSDVAMFSRGRGNLRSRPRGEITHETQRLEKGINRDLSRQGKEAIWATGFITRSAVPDNARRLVAAVEKLFGVRVEFVQVGDERANIFNGVFLGGNTLFVNVDSSSPVSTVIGHEFLHFLKESNPDLYAKAESVLLALANAKKFAAAATKHQPAMNAGEEVIADTFGDQFSNPEFWEEMANRVEPSLFMRIRAAFTRFMGKLLGEIKAMGTTHKTDALYSDLDAVRDAVLSATVGAAKGRKLATPSWSNLHARFMTAWHGSPHDHDGFDSSKIGTGEGAQAYGYGHYFASRKQVAEYYRDTISQSKVDMQSLAQSMGIKTTTAGRGEIVRQIRANPSLDEASIARKVQYASSSMREVEQDGLAKLIAAYRKDARGRLYQVELAPKESEYLDWDKPFDEQSPRVQSAIVNDLGVSPDFAAIDGGNTGKDIYRALAEEHGGDRAASELLLLNGVRGIRYLDGSSRSAGEGNSNYVIFHDADVKITAKESRRASNSETGSTINTIAAAIRKTYGDVLDKLQAKNLITLTQTQDEAIEAAAKARAKVTGERVEDVKRSLMASVKNQAVWHGTPHRGIEKTGFRLIKIGTGEGAQAYGYGLYFAGAREVAEGYRQSTSRPEVEIGGRRFKADGGGIYRDDTGIPLGSTNTMTHDDAARGLYGSKANQPIEVLAEEAESYLQSRSWMTNERIAAAKKAILNGEVKLINEGQLYSADIPENDELLDWDNPLSEQPGKVREAIKAIKSNTPKDMLWMWDGVTPQTPGRQLYGMLGELAAEMNPEGADDLQQAASELMLEHGIPGLRYLDGNSRGNDEGTHNYVIWDEAQLTPEAAQIEPHYSKNGDIEGFFDPVSGKSFLIADALTEETAPGTLMHEVGIHMAAEKDGPMQKLIARAGKLRQKWANNKFVQEAEARMREAGETSDEEFLAYTVTQYENNRAGMPVTLVSLAKDFIAAVKAWMFNKGYLQASKLTVADLAAIARANARKMARGMEAGANAGANTRQSVAQSKEAREFAETERAYGGREAYDRAKADGKTKLGYRQWVQVRTDSFKKWFGDWENDTANASKVADPETGKPLVVYHGTGSDFDVFDESAPAAHWKMDGFYFAQEPSDASRFAESSAKIKQNRLGNAFLPDGANVMPVYLSLQNPKVIEFSRRGQGGFVTADEMREILAEAKFDGHDGAIIKGWQDGSGEVQYVAFRPEQVKSATGNTGAFDGANPDIRYSRNSVDTAEGKYPGFIIPESLRNTVLNGVPLFSRSQDNVRNETGGNNDGRAFQSGIPQGPIWSAPEMSRTDNIIYTMQDKNIDLKRVQQAIKETVGEIRDDIDAYLQEELFHGRAAKITEEFLDKEVNPLISLMRASNVSMEEMETFLWARHAKERNAQIAKINDEMPDGGSGLTNKQADDLMGGKDVTIGDKTIEGVKPNRKELLSNLAGRVDAITRGNRALLEHYSLESADTLNAWDGAYKHYVPLHREDADSHLAGMGTGMGYSVKGASSKRATGSSRPVENILANLALKRERIITRGEKNRVAQSLYGLAKEMPNADLWEVDVKPTIRTTAMVEGREQVVDAVDPNFRNRPNVVFARFNGEDRFVVFNEHNERAVRMAEALKNLDADDISHALGEVSRWTRYFASINTQYNPIFGVTNLVRDVQTGLLNLKSTPIAGKQKEMMGHLVQALPAVFKALRAGRKGQAATGTWAQLLEEFQEVGGQTGYRDMFRNSQERAEALQNALDPTWWQKTWWGKAATVGGVLAVPEQAFLDKVGKPLMELLSDYNTMMENGIRLAAYKVALDTGMTQARAASLAKNLTVNFNRKGQAARQVGAMYAFFNASVQGTARMAETLNHGAKPGELLGKAGKQIVYGGLLLGAVQAMLLMAAGFDDEEPPEFVRDRNIIIPTGNGKYVSIPMPLGFHVLPAISRISIEFTAGGFKKPGEHLVHIMDVLLDSFNPIGNAGLSMQTVAPTVLDPIAALTENKDWSGRQIARQDFSKLNPTPGYTRAKDTASSLSRGLAYAFNYLSGGGEYGIGIVSPTPDQIDYLLGQLTGGVGRELGKVLTTGETMATGEDLPPHKIPLVGRFYGDTTGQSSEASKFYGTLEKLSEHRGTLDRMKDAHDLEAYREYAKEHPESRLYARAARVQRELASLRKLKRKMIERNADRAKVRQIEDRMRTLMTRFNQSVSEQKGDH